VGELDRGAIRTVTGSAEAAAIRTSIAGLRSGSQVASVSDPFQSGLVSKNGQVALATVSFTAAADSDVTTAALSGLTSATAGTAISPCWPPLAAPLGFEPCALIGAYGLAESTLAVTGRARTRSG
jgi:RND superfamily putative drug exporter